MANQPETITYPAGIYQVEIVDPVQGGVGGLTNLPLLQLANRTAWLKDAVDGLGTDTLQLDGSTPMTGDLAITKANARLVVDATSGGAGVLGRRSGTARWLLQMGNGDTEVGANAGSNFTVTRYDDAGASLGVALTINRATGNITIPNDLAITGALRTGDIIAEQSSPSFTLDCTSGANEPRLISRRSGVDRWTLLFGDTTAESGGNAGSDFALMPHSDAGANLAVAFRVTRSGVASIPGSLTIAGGAANHAGLTGGAVGQMMMGVWNGAGAVAFGATVPGADLAPCNTAGTAGSAQSGTWRCLGNITATGQITLWQRVS